MNTFIHANIIKKEIISTIGIIVTYRINSYKYKFHIFSKTLNLDNNLVQRSAIENSYPTNSLNCDEDLVLISLVRGVAIKKS